MKCRRPRGKELDPFTRSLALRWGTMMSRCYNQNRSKYKDYGARGIKVCEDWHDIRVFAKWCKENGYKPELQLDRIDNNGDYCPENCRFVSPRENSQNKRKEMIKKMHEPYWDKSKRRWILKIDITDKDAGQYTQIIEFAALISYSNWLKNIQQR